MSHTPGEWIWDEPSNWNGLSARVCTEKYEPIAQVQISGWPKRIGRANAALIAAAPDLLDACKMAIEDHQCAQLTDGPHEGCPCWYCVCCAAIAKAESPHNR